MSPASRPWTVMVPPSSASETVDHGGERGAAAVGGQGGAQGLGVGAGLVAVAVRNAASAREEGSGTPAGGAA